MFLERARRLVVAHGDLLADATAGDLLGVVDRLGPVAGELQRREPGLEVSRHVVVDELRDGRLSGAGWRQRAEALGIEAIPLRVAT